MEKETTNNFFKKMSKKEIVSIFLIFILGIFTGFFLFYYLNTSNLTNLNRNNYVNVSQNKEIKELEKNKVSFFTGIAAETGNNFFILNVDDQGLEFSGDNARKKININQSSEIFEVNKKDLSTASKENDLKKTKIVLSDIKKGDRIIIVLRNSLGKEALKQKKELNDSEVKEIVKIIG